MPSILGRRPSFTAMQHSPRMSSRRGNPTFGLAAAPLWLMFEAEEKKAETR